MNKFGVLIGIVCIFLIHNLDGVYGNMQCSGDEIDDLNENIKDALIENPERDLTTLSLSAIYYDRYESLKMVKVSASATQSDCDSVKKMLRMFLEIASEIKYVIDEMERAVDTLTKVEYDNDASIELKYNALSIKTAIKYSMSAQEAEEALERYEAFKKENHLVEDM